MCWWEQTGWAVGQLQCDLTHYDCSPVQGFCGRLVRLQLPGLSKIEHLCNFSYHYHHCLNLSQNILIKNHNPIPSTLHSAAVSSCYRQTRRPSTPLSTLSIPENILKISFQRLEIDHSACNRPERKREGTWLNTEITETERTCSEGLSENGVH
jgi:hypothetical protein